MAAGLKSAGPVSLARLEKDTVDLSGADLVILGCPILAWKPSQPMQAFLARLTPAEVAGALEDAAAWAKTLLAAM